VDTQNSPAVSPTLDLAIPRSVKRSWPRYAAYLIVFLVLSTPAYFGFRWLRISPPPSAVISRLNGFEQVVAYAMSPDGQYAAQAIRSNGRTSLTMVHLGSNSRIQLMPPDDHGIGAMKFSRDGNHLYFTRSSPNQKYVLYRTPILTPEPVKLMDDVGVATGISPTNDRVCFVRQVGPDKTAVVLVKLDGTDERTLAIREGEEKYWSWSIDWSPDGRQIAVAVNKSGPSASSRIVTLNAETGEESAVTGPAWGGGGGEGLAWMTNGSGIIFAGSERLSGVPSQLWHVAFPSGDIRKITNDVEAYAVPYVTKDGQIMSAQWEDTNAIWVDAAPFDSAAPLTSAYKHSLNWVRSNSRGHIVFGSSARGNRDVWLVNSDGSSERQLTHDAGSNVMPVPSEDGRFVVFASNRANEDKAKNNLWRMNLDGGDLKQLTFGGGEIQPTISPDGLWVYYASGGLSGGNNERTLWRVPADGGEPEKLVEGPAYGAGISPDSKLMAAWYKPADQGWKLAIFKADGGPPVRLFDAEPGVPVKWAPDGKAIAYLRSVGGVSNIWKQPLTGGVPIQVTRFTSMSTHNFDWTIDGRIVCSRSERITNVVMIRNF
jgi:Tol biopolymer transport system component